MTESAPFTKLQELSTALAGLVASTAPSITAVQSHRSRSSGFVWGPGLIVTADEALSEEGDYAVTLSGGDTVPAQLGRPLALVAGRRDRRPHRANLRLRGGAKAVLPSIQSVGQGVRLREGAVSPGEQYPSRSPHHNHRRT